MKGKGQGFIYSNAGMGILSITIILALFAFVPEVLSAPVDKQMPSVIGLSTWGQGSKGYVIITAISNAIEQQTGIKVRVIPAVADKARLIAVLRGEALACNMGLGAFVAAGGILEWQQEGPQLLNILWAGAPGVATLVTKADSNLKTWKDIKGKRLADCRKLVPSASWLLGACLAFGGLTFDDLISIPVPPYAPSTKALMDGAVDVAFDANSTPAAYELASSPRGAYFFELPPENLEGWKKFWKVLPTYQPYAFTWGVGASKASPKYFPASALALHCHPEANEELVYTVTKAIHRGYDIFKGAHGECMQWNIENALDLNLLRTVANPYHPGAIRYFKEIKRWNEEHERWYRGRIEWQAKMKQAHQETVEQATKTGIARGSKEFGKLWSPKWDQLSQQLVREK